MLDPPRQSLLDLLTTDVLQAAPALLGWDLVRGTRRARIVETEAYAQDDPACHAFRGMTKRNAVLFGHPGNAYVYFTYGCHWMLNVAAHEHGIAAAVLIRAAEPLEGLDEMRIHRPGVKDAELLNGPGKLAKAFGITGEDNGVWLLGGREASGVEREELLLEPGIDVERIVTGPRIGITLGTELPWRYMDADHLKWVSRPRPKA
ncbi:MAG TPA: DNA-3-methyladenine glycosylase [Fimbriimonas sp.]